MDKDLEGVKIVLGPERSKRFRECFVECAYRILKERKLAAREQAQVKLMDAEN